MVEYALAYYWSDIIKSKRLLIQVVFTDSNSIVWTSSNHQLGDVVLKSLVSLC